jgi:hypothetical protein
MKALRLAALCFAAAACGRSGPSGPVGDVVDAWKKAGLDPAPFVPAEKPLPGGTCSAGKVSGLEVMVCEFADADSAKKAEAAGLAQVGDATGAALAQGKLVLVVADRGKSDPSGKKIKDLAAGFRNR